MKAGRGRAVHPDGQEGLGGPPRRPSGIGRPPQKVRRGRERLRGPSRGPEGVGRPSQWAGISLEAHLEDREGSGDPPEEPTWVRRPSRRADMGRETLPESRHGSGDPPRGPTGVAPGVSAEVGRCFWRVSKGQEAFSGDWDGEEGHPGG